MGQSNLNPFSGLDCCLILNSQVKANEDLKTIFPVSLSFNKSYKGGGSRPPSDVEIRDELDLELKIVCLQVGAGNKNRMEEKRALLIDRLKTVSISSYPLCICIMLLISSWSIIPLPLAMN